MYIITYLFSQICLQLQIHMLNEFDRLYYLLEAFHLRAANPIFFDAIVSELKSGNADRSQVNARLINRVLDLEANRQMPDGSQIAKTVETYLKNHR